MPHGLLTVDTCFGDSFEWRKVTTCLNNVIIGTLALDHHGELVLRNAATGDRAVLTFHKTQGWLSSSPHPPHHITGTVFDAAGTPRFSLEGGWSSELWASPLDRGVPGGSAPRYLLWRRQPLPQASLRQYGMSAFGMGLNLLPAAAGCGHLPPTDARRRPDSRAMEVGDERLAASEKDRLEQKQRAGRKARAAQGASEANDWGWRPRWFEWRVPGDEPAPEDAPEPAAAAGSDMGEACRHRAASGRWVYAGGYWEEKDAGHFGRCPDVY